VDFFIQLLTDPLGFYSAHQLLISQIGINALLTLSMYVTLNCGLLTLANVGFMAIGAYTSVLLGLDLHLPVLVTLLVGGTAAALVSVPIGLPVLRLSGVFLAIATIGFGQVVVGAILNIPITGEGQGLTNVAADPGAAIVYIALALVVTMFVLWRLGGSRLGQAWAAIREDSVAAAAHGINVARYRLLAFILGAFIAGCAGGLDANLNFFIDPSEYQFTRVVGVLVFAVVGGFTNVIGPVVGATLLTSLPEILRFAKDYRDTINGLVLIAVILFRPQGLVGGRIKSSGPVARLRARLWPRRRAAEAA
jgi:branched-chain amino acid transport system permease protein